MHEEQHARPGSDLGKTRGFCNLNVKYSTGINAVING
jgi:hypothetical protein